MTATKDQDCAPKRAEFIDSAVKTREAFKFAHPLEIIKAVEKYSSAFYGCVLYDLRGKKQQNPFSPAGKHTTSAWNMPRNCHSCFVDTVHALVLHCHVSVCYPDLSPSSTANSTALARRSRPG